jgi:hypothetical protein
MSEPQEQLDLSDGDIARQAVGEASLRLMAGVVTKPKLAQLKITAQDHEDQYPWEKITRAILADEVDGQHLVQRGLAAQRDWVLRGGRVAKGPSVTYRAKGFFARLAAQLVFGLVFVAVIICGLLLLELQYPAWDIDRLLDGALDLLGQPPRGG